MYTFNTHCASKESQLPAPAAPHVSVGATSDPWVHHGHVDAFFSDLLRHEADIVTELVVLDSEGRCIAARDLYELLVGFQALQRNMFISVNMQPFPPISW